MRFKLVSTLAMSYKRRTLAEATGRVDLNHEAFELQLLTEQEHKLWFCPGHLLLYLLWLEESWLSSIRTFAAASKVTVWVLDTRKSMTNFWLMMRRDLSFLLLPAVKQEQQEKMIIYGYRNMKNEYENHLNLQI